jgi:hypothetical protein
MAKTLEQAIAQLSRLPEPDQQQIGRKLLSHVEKLNAPRAEIDKGLRSLDAGKGVAVNIEELILQRTLDVAEPKLPMIWAPEALEDIDRLWDYYAEVAGRASADKLLRQIAKVVAAIDEFRFREDHVTIS